MSEVAGQGGAPDAGGMPGAAGMPDGGSEDGGSTGKTAGAAGAAGSGGDGGVDAGPFDVMPSIGCGVAAKQLTEAFVKYTIQTSGVKDADCADRDQNYKPVCGPWSLVREYYVWLPADYDEERAYPLVIQGTGCGGIGTDVYDLSPDLSVERAGVDQSVIRVGLTPPPMSVGHATFPTSHCYDDKEGDDSFDYVFYEAVLDKLRTELCFDENRVFASGNSTGGILAEELACRYAGNTAGYAIRGSLDNGGYLPEPPYETTCSGQPSANLWVHATSDPEMPFGSTKYGIKRAMQVNGCTKGTSYDDATFVDYPIGEGNVASVCKQIVGCPPEYPLVVCALPGNQHAPNPTVANPAFATFIDSLKAP
jgi:poly(3-hydroxybutyrate) depolymerase